MHYEEPCLGRGEVWIRGPSVAKGYFKQPEKTREVFVEAGWFRTGDVAIWLPDGALKIVDRLKNSVDQEEMSSETCTQTLNKNVP